MESESADNFTAGNLAAQEDEIEVLQSIYGQDCIFHKDNHSCEEGSSDLKKERTDAAVARFFYYDLIDFDVARSNHFKTMLRKIGECGPTYIPPSSKTLRTTLLEMERREIAQAAKNIKFEWARHGVTLIPDGWSDTSRRSIHGLVAYSRGEMFFVSLHDAPGTSKSADVLAHEWVDGIEMVGVENVVALMTDGESINRAINAILEGCYPHITMSYCMAHCLNNLLKEIGKLSWVEPIITKASEIVTFVLNHEFVRHEFTKKSRKILLKYSNARLGFNFLMLGRLRECSGAVREVFVNDEFKTSPLSSTLVGIACMGIAEDMSFWDEVKRIDAMVQPIVHLLRLVDSMRPCIGKVYNTMYRMIEKLQELVPDKCQYEEIHNLCVTQWDAYRSPLHAAAFMLDPEFQGCGQENDKEVSDLWRCILERMVPNEAIRCTVRDQLMAYMSFCGSFGCADAQVDRFTTEAALWWEDYGSDGPQLQQLAVRILSQAASCSCSEQFWSSYNHIVSKKRSNLGVQKVNYLDFINANLRTLYHSASAKADPFTQWEMEQEENHAGGHV